MIVTAALEAKNYWKAISLTFIVENNIIDTSKIKNDGTKGHSNADFNNNMHGGRINNENGKKGNSKNYQEKQKNSEKIGFNNSSQNLKIQTNEHDHIFEQKILSKLEEYANYYRELSKIINRRIESDSFPG